MTTTANGSRLEGARALELLDELVTAWRSDYASTPTVRLAARDHHAVALVLHGLMAQTANLAAAFLNAHRAGDRVIIVPLARQMIETAVTAIWVELTDAPAADALMAEQTRQQLNQLREFVRAGLPESPEAIDRLAEDSGWFLAHDAGRHFEARCREIEGGVGLYALYRVASESSHATTAVVDAYLEVPQPGASAPAAVRFTPRVENYDAWVRCALAMLVHAWIAYDRLDKEHRARGRLRAVARELGDADAHALTVEGMRAQRARIRAERLRRKGVRTRPRSTT